MAKKFVVAMMMHETNTFSPLPTPIESFARAGALGGPAAIKEAEGTNTSLGGFIEVARKAGAEFTVPMAASAHPSGLVTKAAYEQMTTAIVDEIKKGCDAVLLALHGAMVAEHYDDGEGELLNRIRKIAPDVPIAVALDFHTQMTDAMIKGATIITGYRTYPHIDMADTARRAGRTLMRMLAGEVEPRMVWGNRPDHEQLAGPHALARADEDPDGHGQPGRGHRPGAERLGVRRLPAGRHPAPRAVLGDRLRQAHGRGRDPAEQDPRYRLGEARRLPVPSRAAVGPGGARQVARRRPGRHGRPRRQHRLGRHAGRDERRSRRR